MVRISPAKNGRMAPRLLACDLDGTLLNGQGVMTSATLAALYRAREAGIEVMFATGRRHSYACKVLETAGYLQDAVLVSSNGAMTRTLAGETTHRMSMPVETALLVCRELNAYRESLVFTFDRTGPGSMVVEDVEALHRRLPRWVDHNRHEIASCVPLERAFDSGEEPIQAMICGTVVEMQGALQFLASHEAAPLRERIEVHRTEYAHRNLSVLDLMPSGCSKGNAVARVAAMRGFQAAEIACIGDNMNDADMLALAGHPVVMQNATADLLRLAETHGWTVTGSHDEDGAAKAILQMLEALPTLGILACAVGEREFAP